MTKIVTKLPVTKETLQRFREDELRKTIDAATAELEENFAALCDEFAMRFDADEWILMANKDVYYVNDIVGLLPNLANRNCDYQRGDYSYNTNQLNNLKFEGFDGDEAIGSVFEFDFVPFVDDVHECSSLINKRRPI